MKIRFPFTPAHFASLKTVQSLANLAMMALISALIVASGCATAPKTEPKETLPSVQQSPESSNEPRIDLRGLQRSLGMLRDSDDLGYKEKGFDTCVAGYGYSSSQDCRKAYLAVVNFRLQCRDSDGTVSTASHILTPITSNSVKWAIGQTDGVTSTDGEGFGQIVTVLPKPSKTERFRITSNAKYLVVRAGEVSRFVVPKDWCE